METIAPSYSSASYEEQKKKSILEFCQEDPKVNGYYQYSYLCEPDVWEGGKRDFVTQLYEKDAAVRIPPRHILKVLWTVEILRRKNIECSKLPSPTLLARPTDELPSIVSNIELIGTFSPYDWKEGCDCQQHEPDGNQAYRVVDFDVTVADGSVMKLNAVVNEGDANTGYWGGIFLRDSTKKVATIRGFEGDCETIVEEVPNNLGGYVPFAESDLDFLTSYLVNEEGREEDSNDGMQYDFFDLSISPGRCETQFEKIMGMVMDRFMTPTDRSDWDPKWRKLLRVKKSSSAYWLYQQEVRPIIKSENPHMNFGTVAKLLSARYSGLNTEEMKRYMDLALEDTKRYHRELEECNDASPSDRVKRVWEVSGKTYGGS